MMEEGLFCDYFVLDDYKGVKGCGGGDAGVNEYLVDEALDVTKEDEAYELNLTRHLPSEFLAQLRVAYRPAKLWDVFGGSMTEWNSVNVGGKIWILKEET